MSWRWEGISEGVEVEEEEEDFDGLVGGLRRGLVKKETDYGRRHVFSLPPTSSQASSATSKPPGRVGGDATEGSFGTARERLS